ncbi:MAG TPA: RHS repeat-associated core domain-containing protein [Caulobacteraceae bacterium]
MRGRLGSSALVLTIALTLAAFVCGETSAQTLPAMKFVTAPLVSPSAAQTYYGSATAHTYSLAGVSGFGVVAPEIVETARALKNNPDTIFDFVRNGVETEFAFGERKGPIGTLIDKSGTPFDQNALFVDLVQQAGYPARYQIGQVTMTQAAFAAWTGVSDLGAACRLLSSGGIPASFTPSAPSTCATSGAFTSVTLLHVWSQVQIGGTWYYYDPALKTYATDKTPVNLISASGLVSGGAASAAATGMTSGTSGGANYIQNLSNTSLNTYLTGLGTTLLAYLKANNGSWDIDEVSGVTKIQQVWAPSGGWRNTSPAGYTLNGTPITITCQSIYPYCDNIPDQYRTKLQVQMSIAPDTIHYQSALSWTFFVDDIDGRRLEIGTNFNDKNGALNPAAYASGSTISPKNYTVGTVNLQVDDVVLQSWSCNINYYTTPICFGAQSPGQVTLTATHPYAAGTFANETVTKQLTATAAPATIISGWGMISPARLARWSQEIAFDTPLPAGGTPPWICDSDGDYCFEQYAQTSGDLTNEKLAAQWLAEITRVMKLQTWIAGARVEHQHSIGVVDWRHAITGTVFPPPQPPNNSGNDFYGVTDQFSDLNIDSVVSVTSLTNSASQVATLSRSIALASATLEGSVLEQMQDLPDSASTASRFGWGNDPGADNSTSDPEDPCFTGNHPRAFFDYTGTTSTTRASLYQFEGSASGCDAIPLNFGSSPSTYINAAESGISQYLAAGFHVTGSAETFLGPGARFGPCSGKPSQTACQLSFERGNALVATQYDGSGNVLEVAHVLTSESGISKGGGGAQPERFNAYDPANAGDVLKDRFVDRSVLLGVDLKTGTAGYTTPSLISIGNGQAPYKLDYSLSFKAAPSACNPFGPCVSPVEGGWTNNWDVRFSNSASGDEALGATSPFAAAGTLAAFLAMQDIFAGSSTANLNQDVYAALVADWWRAQMIANTATVSRGFSGQQYVRLVDGSWMPPVGAPGTLVQTGARVKIRPGCHTFGSGWNESTARFWDNSAVSFKLTNASGDVMNFAPYKWEYEPLDDNSCAVTRGYIPTTWIWPQGVSLTFTYGTQSGGHTVDYTTGVTQVTTSLGRTMAFANAQGGLAGTTATVNGITVGQIANSTGTSIVDAVGSSTGGNTGKAWNLTFTPILARSATQRPVPYPQLSQMFEPVNSTLPALQYAYDTRGLVETAYDADGLQVIGEANLPPYAWYLALGGRGERDDPDGGAYSVSYDTDGNAVRNIDEIGREVDSAWDGRHRVTQRTFPEGDEEQFAYDGLDNVLSLTEVAKPGSGLANTLVQATYDPTWNHLASITDALSNTTNFTYYPSGAGASLMEEAQRPAVNGVRPTYTFAYNAIGLLTQSVDAAGITTAHAYDSYGNLTSTTEGAAAVGTHPALNLTTGFTPDAWGNVTATTTPLGHVSNATFDPDRRKLMDIDADPTPGSGTRTATRTTYDANGRVIEVDKGTTNASGGSFAALETTLTTYDPNGNRTEVQALNGTVGQAPLTVVQMSYDPLNRPICLAERNNAVVFGSLPTSACVQSAGGTAGSDHISQAVYDLAGQKLTETRGVGTPIQGLYGTWTYGGDGEVLTTLDANNNLTSNIWDGFNRLSKLEFPSRTLGAETSDPADVEAYSYDANNNRLTLTKRDGITVITYGYDVLNRRTAKTFAAPWTADNVAYGYDLAGRPLSALYSNQGGTPGVAWTYDAAGRRISEATNGLTLGFTYDSDSNPASLTWPDTASVTFAYDPADRFGSVSNSAMSVAAGYDTLSRVNALTRPSSTSAVGYDKADRMASLAHVFSPTTGNETWTQGYTAGGQLAQATSSNGAWDWQAASKAAIATSVNGLNQNAAVGGTSWTYDANGNLTSDGVRTFGYDPENRLLTESGPITMTLAYDPTGRLEQSVINGTTTGFLYDGDALVAEYNGSGSVLRRYVHGPQVDNPLVWFEGSSVVSTNANYLIADRQGSIAGVANSSGAVTANYTYDAYGAPGAWGTVGTAPRFRYTGQIAIPEAQLYYYKARVYDPGDGKFLQTDPVGDQSDLNLYAYVRGDPIDSADPSGDCPISTCGVGGGALDIQFSLGPSLLQSSPDSLGGSSGATGGSASGSVLSAFPMFAQNASAITRDTAPVPQSEGGSGYSSRPPGGSFAEQKAAFNDPKQNGIPEAKRQEAIGMAAVPLAGIALGLGGEAVAGVVPRAAPAFEPVEMPAAAPEVAPKPPAVRVGPGQARPDPLAGTKTSIGPRPPRQLSPQERPWWVDALHFISRFIPGNE